MSLIEQIDKDYIAAYKAKDDVKKTVLRHLKTAIKNRIVEVKGDTLSDDDVLDLVAKQIKQRKDSIEQYNSAGRPELAEIEAVEIEALSGYMPEQLSEEEVAAAIDKAIADTGASSMQDMGKVMKIITETYKGQVDGKVASGLVRARLS
ncbi:GatB/YqeY domain-containing protein [Desulfovibrio sp. JC010]|uniref:GatB/YqeY domain-containing protein n=1 Tax=Desulfovibrio sp. JC010 TaxID=2593641 RepID=UPI0013D59C6A|nr:GatB/YqeY domain-containing protein [Desulfovibrio sp. JC010]NDV27376.1 GatB/YqeY domain-containing protein [Desulfovibrio sp. JC010]